MERALASRVSIRQEKTTIRQLINNAAPCTWIQILCIVNSTTSDTMGTVFHLCGSTVGATIDPNWRATHSLVARWPPHARSRDISYLDLGSAPAPNRRDTHSTLPSLAARCRADIFRLPISISVPKTEISRAGHITQLLSHHFKPKYCRLSH